MPSKSNFQFYTVDEIISAIYTRIDHIDDRDELVYRDWIYDAEREIGAPNLYIKKKKVPVTDFMFEKPCDLAHLVDLNLLGSGGQVYNYEFDGSNFLDSEVALDNTDTTYDLGLNRSHPIRVAEQEHCFVIGSNANGVVEAEMSYYAFPIKEDDDGTYSILIPETHKLAVISYVEFQHFKRERNRTRKQGNLVPMSEVTYYEDKWIREMQKSKGRNKMPNLPELDTIAFKWMTMIPNYKDKARHRNYNTKRY